MPAASLASISCAIVSGGRIDQPARQPLQPGRMGQQLLGSDGWVHRHDHAMPMLAQRWRLMKKMPGRSPLLATPTGSPGIRSERPGNAVERGKQAQIREVDQTM
jgi:hypothetical protein